MNLNFLRSIGLVMILGGLASCAPRINVLDRPTLMQEESVGEFPDLEKEFGRQGLQLGPKMLDRSQLQQKQTPEKALNILDGELIRESAKN